MTDDRLAAIDRILRDHFAPESLEVRDESAEHAGHAGAASGGGHYRLTIVADAFREQDALARHRLIYSALGQLMEKDIHALSIQAFSPDEI
ncbi:MAG: BolA family transcriptional regulator [Gammaproteobacteria bacterium]|nr:BolA family transcriptional regulator [Gammaproteobacteria bacterium]